MPATADPVAGILTYFALGTSLTPTVPEDISNYLDSIDPSSEADELDGTNFRATAKKIIPGFKTITYSVGGKWSALADEFWRDVDGLSGLTYEYGPGGNLSGGLKITGTCSVKSYSGPSSNVDDVITYTAELAIDGETAGAFTVTTTRREGESDQEFDARVARETKEKARR